jgi:hypothetical protein
MNVASLIALLFSLKAQLATLQAELLTLENSTTTAQVSSTPMGFVSWHSPSSTQNARWTAPVLHEPSSSPMLPMPENDAPLTLGAEEPTSTPLVEANIAQDSGIAWLNSSTIRIFLGCMKATELDINLNGTDYPLTVGTYGQTGGRFDVNASSAGLLAGNSYPDSFNCENATQYYQASATITL